MSIRSTNASERAPAVTARTGRWAPLLSLLILVIGLAAIYWDVKSSAPSDPAPFVRAGTIPTLPTWREEAWYWIEKPDRGNARLARAARDASGGATAIAEAAEIPSFDVRDGYVAWAAHESRDWVVYSAPVAGGDRRALWRGAAAPGSVRIADGRLFWTLDGPGALANSGPFPPLAPTVQVMAAPLTGGAVRMAATLMETGVGRVVGFDRGALYVAVQHPRLGDNTTFYRASLDDGTTRRIAGESGACDGMTTQHGELFWTAPSREAANAHTITCVRYLNPRGVPETLTEWLPGNGTIAETARGLIYVDGSYKATAWPVGRHDERPRGLTMPAGYIAVAAGGTELLLRRSDARSNDAMLYRMPLP